MRAGLVVLLALALAYMGATPAQATCVQVGCVQAPDHDGDGVPDEATLATASPLHAFNLHARDNTTFAYLEVLAGEEHEGPAALLTVGLDANLENHDDDPNLRSANVTVTVSSLDEHDFAYLAWVWVTTHDHDDDHWADEVHVEHYVADPEDL